MRRTGPFPPPEGSYAGTPSTSAPGGRGGALWVGHWIKKGVNKGNRRRNGKMDEKKGKHLWRREWYMMKGIKNELGGVKKEGMSREG